MTTATVVLGSVLTVLVLITAPAAIAATPNCACGPATENIGANAVARALADAAAVDIPRRRGPGSDAYLPDLKTKSPAERAPYARTMPAPYVDRRDADQARAACAPVFVIGGVNCDETIRRAKSLTGVRFEDLSLRMRGTPKYGSYNGRPHAPEWADQNGVWMRTSSEGWIDRLYTLPTGDAGAKPVGEVDRVLAAGAVGELRRVLVNDNRDVLARGLTHQDVARPMLTAIQNYIATGQTRFTHAGRTFRVESKSMGGAVELLSDDPPALTRRRESGWTGRGVQGSPFDDELFANSVFTFRTDSGETLTIDGLTPHLIHRYGFYQGGPYRTEPAAIEHFFGIKPAAPGRGPNCPP